MIARQMRPGVTLIQTLVSLSLGLVATSVALPAVMKLRAAADVAKCADNLRLLGTGIRDYAAAHNDLLPKNNTNTPTPKGSYITRVLPYTGPESIAQNYHWDLDWSHPDNAKFVETRLPMAQCPATPNPERWIEGDNGRKFKAAPSDYVAIGQLTNALKMAGVFPADADLTSVMPGGTTARSRTSRMERPTPCSWSKLPTSQTVGKPGNSCRRTAWAATTEPERGPRPMETRREATPGTARTFRDRAR